MKRFNKYFMRDAVRSRLGSVTNNLVQQGSNLNQELTADSTLVTADSNKAVTVSSVISDLRSQFSLQNDKIFNLIPRYNVVITGDSTSGVYDILPSVASLMGSKTNVISLSISGQTIALQKSSWNSYSMTNAKCVFVFVGLNDLGVSSATLIAAYQDYVNTIRSTIGTSGKIVLVTMIPCERSSDQQWIDLNDAILGNGATPITGYDSRINLIITALNSGTNTLATAYNYDNLHENTLGRQLIADLFDAKLIELGIEDSQRKLINIGTVVNDQTGDTIKASFVKLNNKYTELLASADSTPSVIVNIGVVDNDKQGDKMPISFEKCNTVYDEFKTKWILPIKGRTSGTATAGTIYISCTEDTTPTKTGDVTISVARSADSSFRRHTITFNCPNNGSGTIVFPDRTKIVSLGNHNGASDPTTNFIYGNENTAPIVELDLNQIPESLQKINLIDEHLLILPTTGNKSLPSGLTYLNLNGYNIAWTYNGALPTGLTYLKLSGNLIAWTYNGALPTGILTLFLYGARLAWSYNGALPTGLTYAWFNTGLTVWIYNGALPTGLTYFYTNGYSSAWTYDGAFPAGLTYLGINSQYNNWTGLDISGSGNLTNLSLSKFRGSKITSTDLVTLINSITNRVGSVPNTITINDYVDYASPPQTVLDAIVALKAVKTNVTAVNLGA